MKNFNEHNSERFILEEISEIDEQTWKKCLHRSNNKHNEKIMARVVAKVGKKALKDFKKLVEELEVDGNLKIRIGPCGHNNEESCGVFKEVWVEQWSVGIVGDSFKGSMYAKFADSEWLEIPFSC